MRTKTVDFVCYCFLALLAYALCVASVPARAQVPQVELKLICNTVDQLTRFYAVVENDPEVAVEQVNAEEQAKVCGFAYVVYIRGPTYGTVKAPNGVLLEVAPIIVIAMGDGLRLVRIPPYPQFTVFAKTVVERGA